MNEKLAGQVRHILGAVGGAIAGEPVLAGAAPESLEQIIGGLVLTLAMQAWSWWAKRRAEAAAQ